MLDKIAKLVLILVLPALAVGYGFLVFAVHNTQERIMVLECRVLGHTQNDISRLSNDREYCRTIGWLWMGHSSSHPWTDWAAHRFGLLTGLAWPLELAAMILTIPALAVLTALTPAPKPR